MTMLPDVDTQSWQDYQGREFSAGADRRIDSLSFSAAADQRIADLSSMGSLVPDAAQAPQPTPAIEAPAVPTGASVPPEPAVSPQGFNPDLLDLSKPAPIAPTAPLPSPSSLPRAPSPTRPAAAADSNLVAAALSAADEAGVDPGLFVQLVNQESRFDPNARSPVGARGLTQLMPDTARGLGVTNVDDPIENLKGGARYLKQQLDAFGGDVTKALAAYNAGPGAVQQYGGVPPYKETQTYVDNILGSLAANQGGVGNETPSQGGPALVPDAAQPARPGRDISQFGDPQLTNEEAYAACGPAAAVRFAQAYGRNPTLREATDLAKTVGWTSGQGMAGLQSEKALMDKLNVPTKLVQGAQWEQFAAEAQTGNPVTISTAGHYFTADGYDPNTGKFHVGRSGLDLKAGSEWMSAADMERVMGAVQGGLLADNPQVPAPSTADQETNPVGWLDRAKDALSSGWNTVTGAVGDALTGAGSVMQQGQDVQTAGTTAVADAAPDVAGEGGRRGLAFVQGTARGMLQRTPDVNGSPIEAMLRSTSPALSGLIPDVGTAITSGLERAGVPGASEMGFKVGPIEVGPRELAGFGAGMAIPLGPEGKASGIVGKAGREAEGVAQRALPGEVLSEGQTRALYESLSGRWDELETQARRLFDDAAAAFNPGLKARLTNEAERLRGQQDEIMRMADHVESTGTMPPGAGSVVDLAETIPVNEAEDLQRRLVNVTTLAADETRPAEKAMLQGEAERIRGRLDQIAPETVAPPVNAAIDDEALRRQGQLFGETQAARKAAQLPRSELPAGARPIDMTPAEDVARLRLEQWPEEIRGTIEQAAQARDFGQTQRRGVVPDLVSEQMADDLGRPLDQWIKAGKAGKAYNAEELRALRNAVGAQAASVRQLASDVRTARSSGNLTDNLLVQQFSEGQKLQALTEILSGATAEWGRAGRAFQGAARLIDLPPNEATARIYKMVGGRDNAIQVLDEYQKLLDTGADVIAQAKFWSNVKHPPPGVTDWFKLIRYNSMLSGPRSFEVNAIGNALELPWRFARDVGASAARGRPEELKTELTGVFAGLDTANRRFMQTLAHGITAEAAAAGEIPQSVSSRLRRGGGVLGSPALRPVATALEVPGRLMGAADEWAQAIAYSMGLGRLAARQASREGLNSTAWRARVSEILSDPTVTPSLMKQADSIAQRMTYHGDMGTLGQGLQAFTQKTGIVGNLVLPFLRTVYHITARGIDRSPAGLIGTGIDIARGVYGRTPGELSASLSGEAGKALPKGVAPLGERVGDNLIGSAIFAGFYKEAADGNISAAGPDDPQRRKLLQSEGWQPYSVRLGDNWVSYANWGPVAIPLSMSAAAAEAQRYAKPGAQAQEIILDGVRRTAQVATQQTYLQSIGAAWLGLTDPQRYGFQWVNNTISSVIPYGAAINTVGQATDEVARRPDRFDIGDAIRYRLPANTPLIGGRDTVPAAQDVLGRQQPNVTAGFAALNPLRVSPERADPVLRELDAVGVAPPGPPTTMSRQGKQIELTPDDQRSVQSQAGGVIADRVSTEMGTPSYQTLDVEAKKKRLEHIIDLARTQAENLFLNGLSDEEYQRRVAVTQVKRQPVPIGGR